ncbi:hypothetical protein I8748_32175 [Nostoc sp. CENA67]|uniref:Uncharacterized protein n=1 Tax=Amazonocrinis nigriterrae CENA67 TaxID=2794033 RepID=A0A8J7HVQ6_9NOST|nr:hypothetical protein [Amazonocrinis nigriterrae]MBH8566757.1 hypothetical protein [Amazonocrinis nigriterrae CENA67]
MPIRGLTDQRKEFNCLGRIEISVFKGGRKGEKTAGKDLANKLRITTTNNVAKTILKRYSEPDNNGDFYTEALNIYLPFDEVEKTFNCSMKAHTTSGLELVCDRHTITKRCIPTKDGKGNVWRPLVDVEEVCPMRDKGFTGDCPNRCVKEGQFYFYIRELLDRDMMLPARITVHGFEDLTYLNTKLEEYKELIGSLTRSPFPAHQYRHKIPFILSRTQVKIKQPITDKDNNYVRTGKKTDRIIWALTLQIDPTWMELYRCWQLMEELKFRQLPVSQNAVLGLLKGDTSIIDAEIVEVSQEPKTLPPSRADRLRSRILELANQYEELTGVAYELPDLYAKNEDELVVFGKDLKKSVDKVRYDHHSMD